MYTSNLNNHYHSASFANTSPIPKEELFSARIIKIAAICLRFLAESLANIATFGTYGAMIYFLHKQRFETLVNKKESHEQMMNKLLKEKSNEIDRLYIERNNTNFNFRNIKTERDQLKTERDTLKRENSNYQYTKTQLEKTEKKLQEAETHYRQAEIRFRDNRDLLLADVITFKAKSQSLMEETQFLGPVEPQYKRRPMPSQEEELKGAKFDIRKHDAEQIKNCWKPCYKTIGIAPNNLHTMEGVIGKGFEENFPILLRDPRVVLNNSDQLQNFNERMCAVYQYMILDLITQSGLEIDTCGEKYTIVLNDSGLQVGNSQPSIVLMKKLGRTELKATTIFTHHDTWTPESSDDYPRGVEPVSVKWILERLKLLNPLALVHLECLVLDDLIPNSNPDLIKAKSFLFSASEDALLVKTALKLIQDIASANKNKFGPFIAQAYEKMTDEKVEIPQIDKGFIEIPDPFDGNKTEWILDESIIPYSLLEALKTSKKMMTTISKHLVSSKLLLNPAKGEVYPQTFPGKDFLCGIENKFYYSAHAMLGNNGCLLSALTSALLLNRRKLISKNVQMVKKAMYHYLQNNRNDPTLVNLIEGSIWKGSGDKGSNAITGTLSVEDYLNWLLGLHERHNYYFGPLEIHLFSQTFGINVELFYAGVPIRVNSQQQIVVDRSERNSFIFWT